MLLDLDYYERERNGGEREGETDTDKEGVYESKEEEGEEFFPS